MIITSMKILNSAWKIIYNITIISIIDNISNSAWEMLQNDVVAEQYHDLSGCLVNYSFNGYTTKDNKLDFFF